MSKAERDKRHRVYRGGCWYYTPANAQVSDGPWDPPGFRCSILGFRFVRRRSALAWLADALRGVRNEQEEEEG